MQTGTTWWRASWFATALFACAGEPAVAPEAPSVEREQPVAQEQAAATPAEQEGLASKRYKQRAERLVQGIDAGMDADVILKMADGLTKSGLLMLPAMIEKHPACAAYLNAIADVGPTLKDLPLAEIEKGYHEDGQLPEMPSPECYHGKDLVVHPATVAALAKAGLKSPEARAHAKAEIVEVLSHLGALDAAG